MTNISRRISRHISRLFFRKNFYRKNNGKIFEDEPSPDGKYRLAVASFPTEKGCWDYTQGLVYRAGNDRPIFEVRRNYASFPRSWIDHPNGHQYLVCGADYQGQTVLELDTGRRSDFIPPEAKKGSGFCWVSHRFDASTKILTVCGCVWACPYEFRFYDFSEPMKGWPEISWDEDCIEDDEKWPTFEPDGTIKAYDTKPIDDHDDGDTPKPPVLRSAKTFSRDGLKLKLLNEEVSGKEKTFREKSEESWHRSEEKWTNFKNRDPLYLAYADLIKDPALSPEDHYGIGVTHDKWCPHFKIQEQRFCRRIVASKKTTIDLEWGTATGPIKLVIYKKGKKEDDRWFGHSVEGMRQAFEAAREICKSKT